jgi:hypothetical protein
MTDEQTPTISQTELQRLKQLTAEISEFRKSLAPKYEEIEKDVSALSCFGLIKQIMQFEGKDKFSINVKFEDIPYEVTFKHRKTS